MPDSFERIISFALENVTWIIFALFMLSGLFSKSGGKKTSASDPIQPAPREKNTDNRPLAERMAEHFGIPLEDVQGTAEADQPQPRKSSRPQGRRSTTIGNAREAYPDLYGGGASLWEDEPADDRWGSDQKWGSRDQQWGFDETEWGSTFEKNEDQWGGGFAEKKDSTPRIEIG